MNKFQILPLLLLMCSGLSVAQDNIKVTLGTSYPDAGFNKLFSLGDQTGVLNIEESGKKIILQKIGPDLVLKRVMQYENFPKDFKVERIVSIKGRCFMLYSAPIKKVQSLFAAQIDVKKGELLDGGKEIISPSGDIDDHLLNGDPFEILFSGDSSQVAVCYKIKSSISNSAKNGEVNGIWVFDNTLSERWHAELVLPYNERRAKVLDRVIDSIGNIHFALQVIKDESGIEKKMGQTTPNYSVEILTYRSPSELPKVTKLDLNGKFINSLSLNVANGRLMCSGFYNSKGNDSEVEGVFSSVLSPEQTSPTTFHPFTLSFMNESEKSNRQKSNEKLFAKGKPFEIDLRLIRTIPQADGGTLLLGEQHEVVTQYSPGTGIGGAGGSVSSMHLYFNLIVARLLPDGRLGWIRKLSRNSGSTSFEYYLNDTVHCFLFVEQQDLIGYRLNDVTGQGDRKEIVKFKPLLKRPHAFFTSFVGYPTLLKGKNGVVLTAHLSGDAGRFGETKRYKENVTLKVMIE